MTKHFKIKKSNAQSVITQIKASHIDRDFQIQRDDEYVFVPILEIGELPHLPGTSIVDIPPLRSKSKPKPRTSGGAFDLIGNIAITKIRNRSKALDLAKELMESHPVIKSVYLDKGIVGEHRLRNLELLAGEQNFNTLYRENGITFELDVSKVYFSPRLATERMFVAKDTRDGDTVIDMFAGIGAFSLNIAKLHNAHITAIDSNPDAVNYMKKSIVRNSLPGSISPVCGKAEEVLQTLPSADRIIMNLPHESRHFLRLALGNLKKGGIIHYYEILNITQLEERMEELTGLGFEIRKKREVHGFSASLSMYSITASLVGG